MSLAKTCDFHGWATKNDLECSDGRIIRKNAFKVNDGAKVPLVWNHDHNSPDKVLGHAILENREEGVYAYGFFNDTPQGQNAKTCVLHGDVTALSIWANNLKQKGADVLHGAIREVSLVLAGANPGAFVESVVSHGDPMDEFDEEGLFYTGDSIVLAHAECGKKDDEPKAEPKKEDAAKEPEKAPEKETEPEPKKTDSEDKPKDEPEEEEAEDEETEDEVMKHSDESDDKTVGEIYNAMSDKKKKVVQALIALALEGDMSKNPTSDEVKHADSDGGETLGDIFETFTKEEKDVTYALVGIALQEKEKSDKESDDKEESDDNEEDNNEMKHNVFSDGGATEILSHSDMKKIFDDAKRIGSLRDAVRQNLGEDSVLAHANMDSYNGKNGVVASTSSGASAQGYGMYDTSLLFPDYRSLNATPEFITRDMAWVRTLMGAVRRTPFSRVKSMYANITEDEARAMGYLKGKQKKSEFFTLLKRTTDPQTVYKLQKLDRDDVVDITDFDVVAWLKSEMRVMLDEEIARAILIGDGREAMTEEHISEDHIRPIYNDNDLFTIKHAVAVTSAEANAENAKKVIADAVRARKQYRGSGDPIFFTTEDWLTEMLLLEDGFGHRLYRTQAELATAMRVSQIVTVEPMAGQQIEIAGTGKCDVIAVIVNPADYNVGADKGGAVNLFDDFDIDFNQFKYLIETRMSGALIKPYSAITLYANTNP